MVLYSAIFLLLKIYDISDLSKRLSQFDKHRAIGPILPVGELAKEMHDEKLRDKKDEADLAHLQHIYFIFNIMGLVFSMLTTAATVYIRKTLQ